MNGAQFTVWPTVGVRTAENKSQGNHKTTAMYGKIIRAIHFCDLEYLSKVILRLSRSKWKSNSVKKLYKTNN